MMTRRQGSLLVRALTLGLFYIFSLVANVRGCHLDLGNFMRSVDWKGRQSLIFSELLRVKMKLISDHELKKKA